MCYVFFPLSILAAAKLLASTHVFFTGFVCSAVITNTATNPNFNTALNYPLDLSKSCSGLHQKFCNDVDPTVFLALKLKYWVALCIFFNWPKFFHFEAALVSAKHNLDCGHTQESLWTTVCQEVKPNFWIHSLISHRELQLL